MLPLTLATLIAALILLAFGAAFVLDRPGWRDALQDFPRSRRAAWVTMGLGGAWFLWNVYNLSRADEIVDRRILLLVFGAGWIGSFYYLKDFLAVRGAAILTLLLALVGLNAAFGLYEVPQRLFLVTWIYLCVALALYLGASPYRMRDGLVWLYRVPGRARVLGYALSGYGTVLLLVTLSYLF